MAEHSDETLQTDDDLMALAIEEARLALEHDDVPVGALVVLDGAIIGVSDRRPRLPLMF